MAGHEGIDLYLLKDFLRAGEMVRPAIDRALHECDLFRPPLTFRSRVKGEKTAIAKVYRKAAGNPGYGVRDLSDIVGFRFVTLLKEDIANVADCLLRLLKGDGVPNRGIFATAKLREFKHYIPDPQFSPITHQLINALHDNLVRMLADRFGDTPPIALETDFRAQYSGVHVVMSVPWQLEDTRLDVPCEFQLRSVFEDAWGEIDHKLFYEVDRVGHFKGKQQRLEVASHLRVLKRMLDNAAEYAALISNGNFHATTEGVDIKKNLDGVEYIREICAPFAGNEHVKELLVEFIALGNEKNRLDDAMEKGSLNRTAYSTLADQYSELIKRFPGFDSEPEADKKRFRTILCLLSMEEALCRLLSLNPTQMKQSISQYREIAKKYPEYPTCCFRLAQACAQLMENTKDDDKREALAAEAVEGYRTARKLLDEFNQSQNGTHDLLIMSPGQRSYLDANIERLWGFVLWRKGDLRRKREAPSTERDLEEILEAYAVTNGALEHIKASVLAGSAPNNDGPYVPLLNSATYFALMAHETAEKLMSKSKKILPNKGDIKTMVDQLEQVCLSKYPHNMGRWHTIFVGQRLVGTEAALFRAAKRICEIHALPRAEKFNEYQREIQERAYQDAWPLIDNALKGGSDLE